MGADVLLDSGPSGCLFEDREDHHPRKLSPAVVQEDDLLARPGAPPLFEVALNAFARRRTDRHDPLFVALADHADISLPEKEVLHAQRREFRDPQSARIEHFEHGAVAQSLHRRGVHGGDDAVDLRGGEHVGELAAEFGRQDELRGRRFDLVADHQVVEETFYAAQRPGLRGFLAPPFVEPRHVAFDHLRFDLVGRDVPLAQDEVRELLVVAHVRFDGVSREPLFQFYIGTVTAAGFVPLFRIFCHLLVR